MYYKKEEEEEGPQAKSRENVRRHLNEIATEIYTHIILNINVTHALVIELFLHDGDGRIISWHSVNACVFQSSFFHQVTAHFNYQRNKLKHRKFSQIPASQYKPLRLHAI